MPNEIGSCLKPGMTVFVAGGTAEPRETLQALRANPDCCANVRFISMFFPGTNILDFSTFHLHTKVTSFFATPENRQNINNGRIDYLPIQYRHFR